MATKSLAQQRVDSTIEDYASNMFKDGNNRTETNPKAHDAPAYDRAAHKGEAALPEVDESVSEQTGMVDTFHSRDGTDASGAYDEAGGSLGGTEEELDDLEATGMPVDRTPQMKN